MKKKLFSLLCIVVAVFTLFAFAACKDEEPQTEAQYTMVVPDGAPALAAVSLIDEIANNDKFGSLSKVNIVQSSAIGAEAVKADFAIVPANLAANLYNKGQKIKLLATVTQGNLYGLGVNTQVKNIKDLEGKRVFSIGQGSVPDYIFQTLLKDAGLQYETGDKAVEGKVVITYAKDGSGVMSQLVAAKKNGEEAIGILAEPAVSKALAQGISQIFDLQQLWMQYTGSDTLGYPQAVLIAKADICEKDAAFVNSLVEKMKGNAEFVAQNSDRVDDILKAAYPSTTLNTDMSADTLARCNCKVIKASDAKAQYIDMLEAIMALNPAAIGGKLPDDALYF